MHVVLALGKSLPKCRVLHQPTLCRLIWWFLKLLVDWFDGNTKVQNGLGQGGQTGDGVAGNWIVFLSAHMVTQFKKWQG